MYQGCTVGTRDIVYHNTGTEVGERAGMYQEYSERCTKRYAPVTHFSAEFSPGENEITPGDVFCGHPGNTTRANFETRSVKGESVAAAREEMHHGPPSSPSNYTVITRGRVSCGRTRR